MRRYFVCALLVIALCSLGFAQAAPADKAKAPAAPAADKAKPAAAKPAAKKVDINSASKADLVAVGVDEATAQKIIDGRPYKMKTQLTSKKIVDAATTRRSAPRSLPAAENRRPSQSRRRPRNRSSRG